MSAGAMGAIAGAIGTGITAQENERLQNEWLSLTDRQQEFLRQQLAKIEGIQAPNLNSNLPPPDQLALSQYGNPVLAEATQVNIDPADRANQMSALERLQGVSTGAANSEMNAASYKAMQNAAQQQHGANGAILQSLASRGTLGGGQELAARMQAAQNAAGNSQAGMLDAAKNNALQKLQAQGNYLQGMGQVRGQDTAQASKNADILNQFNMANTGLRNQVNQMNTGLTNEQSLYNTNQNNAYKKALIDLQNNVAQSGFDDKLKQAGMAAGEANTISSNATDAGRTSAALGANTASGIAQGIGNTGNSVAGMISSASQNPDSSGASSYSSPSIPSTKLKNPWGDDEETGT